MLFDENPSESYKERNLYYKFFAGYFFNELVPGWEQRLNEFCQLIGAKSGLPGGITLSPATTHVSFDNHLIQRVRGVDRGEFADILILDQQYGVLVGIEVKYLSDWNYRKDIETNSERLHKAGKELGARTVVQCLLVSRSKWEKSRQKPFLESMNPAIAVILWEELQERCTNEKLVNYLRWQMKRHPIRNRPTLANRQG